MGKTRKNGYFKKSLLESSEDHEIKIDTLFINT